MELNPLQNLYNDFMKIIAYVEIKYNNKAAKYETLEMTKKADEYIAAMRHEDTFLSYLDWKEWMFNKVGIQDVNEIAVYMEDRRRVPEKYRSALLEVRRKSIIESYIEPNNYYRSLNGLPDVDDLEYIYIEPTICNEYIIRSDKPIHELNDTEISILNNIGYLDNLKKKYPHKKYLNFLGLDKISIVDARTAYNFSILRFPSDIKDEVSLSFITIYEQCRVYFMTNLYMQEYTTIYTQYDNFMSLAVMVMAMQQVVMRSIKSVINREFYDERCVRMLFESYSVPFIENLDDDTLRSIIHNLNLLIQFKSTDKVFFNLIDIFGFDKAKLYKYFLVKEQLFDADGFPIDTEKEVENEFGELEIVKDYEKMYNVYFQKVELGESNYYLAMQKSSNKVSYDSIVTADPLWYEDDPNVISELYESEYNFRETKYLGVNITFRLSEIMFNIVYLLRMLFDKKDEISGITMNLPKLFGSENVSLFDAIVLTCSLICKKNHLKGEILCSPSKILHVLGFDFTNDFELIKQSIREDEYLDNDCAKYLLDMTAYTVESVNKLFSNIKGLRDFISQKLGESSNIHEYRTYEKLYRTLYISEENDKMFGINKEGDTASTYLEYLKYNNIKMYQLVVSKNDDDLDLALNHIVSRLTMLIPYLDELNYIIDGTGIKIKALLQLIVFFKSYTTDMVSMNIVYIIDTKILNMLKLIDEIHSIEKILEPDKNQKLKLYDVINTLKSCIYSNDKLALYDKLKTISSLYLRDELMLHDEIMIKVKEAVKDAFNMYDYLNINKILECSTSLLKFKDKATTLSNMIYRDDLSLHDVIMILKVCHMMEEFKIYDVLAVDKKIESSSKFNFRDIAKAFSFYGILDYLKLKDIAFINGELMIKSYSKFYDVIQSITKEIQTGDDIKFRDGIHNIRYLYGNNNDKLNIYDKLYKSVSVSYNKANLIMEDTISIREIINHNETSKFIDSMSINSIANAHDEMNIKDNFIIQDVIPISGNINIMDTNSVIKEIKKESHLGLRDSIKIIR